MAGLFHSAAAPARLHPNRVKALAPLSGYYSLGFRLDAVLAASKSGCSRRREKGNRVSLAPFPGASVMIEKSAAFSAAR